jgi:uncharacterized membrane protein
MDRLKQALKNQGKIWLHGLIVVVPAIVTLWVIVLAIETLDNAVSTALKFILGLFLNGENAFVLFVTSPGVGLIITFLTIYLAGIAAGVWFLRDPMKKVEGIINRVPVVKSIYSAIRDFLKFVGSGEPETRGRPCVVKNEDGTVRMLALLTQPRPERFLPPEDRERVGVYIPMSYQIGGYTVYLPRERVEVIDDMDVEELFKLCMTAGLSSTLGDTTSQSGEGPAEENAEASSADEGKPQ